MPGLESPALDYAPGAPIRRRRRIRRAIRACLALATTVAAFIWGPTTWSRTKLLYHQRQCLTYVAPADEVVFDSNPARVAQLAHDPNYLIARGCAFRKPPAHWSAILTASGSRPTASPTALIFLHELKAGGVRRLVQFERTAAADESPYFLPGYDVATHTMILATFGKPQVTEQQFPMVLDVLDTIGPHLDIRIYAGQPDPADASHFTVRYESQGRTHVAQGHLRPDGQVELKVNP
jgi:hypothetical protein